MEKLKVGDRVVLSDKGTTKYTNDSGNPHDLDGVVTKTDTSHSDPYVYKVSWSNGASNYYCEGELSLTSPQQLDKTWIESLSTYQKKNLLRMLEEDANTEEVVLHSVAGKKWGKKRYPESKLKMTYTLFKGQIQGQPVITKL